jgi:hypothetical protein
MAQNPHCAADLVAMHPLRTRYQSLLERLREMGASLLVVQAHHSSTLHASMQFLWSGSQRLGFLQVIAAGAGGSKIEVLIQK